MNNATATATATATIELTDTFGGEPNYSWVERHTFAIEGLTHRQIESKARELVGLTGVRCTRYDHGDLIEWRPHRACMVAFLTFDY